MADIVVSHPFSFPRYLLFMIVFLPTFGFTTLDATLKFVVDENNNETYRFVIDLSINLLIFSKNWYSIPRWECVFLPDSGAFFVNYIITAAIVGAGLELIRFPELLMYLARVSGYDLFLLNIINIFALFKE